MHSWPSMALTWAGTLMTMASSAASIKQPTGTWRHASPQPALSCFTWILMQLQCMPGAFFGIESVMPSSARCFLFMQTFWLQHNQRLLARLFP